MNDEEKKEAEIYGAMGSTTPDSGIDLSKFNIIDYILSPSEDMEIIPQEEASLTSLVWDISSVSLLSETGGTSNVSPLSNSNSHSSSIPTPIPIAEAEVIKPWTEHGAVTSTPSRSGPQLRTLTKLEFDRKKAIHDTQREEEAHNKFHKQRSNSQSNPVDLPVSASPMVSAIPQNLLEKVETRLENPTDYYLQERFRHNNAALYATSHNGLGGSVPPTTHTTNAPHGRPPGRMAQMNGITLTGPGSAPPNIFSSTPLSPLTRPLQLDTGVPLSPGRTISSVATSITSGCSDNCEPFGDPDINSSLSEIHDIISQGGDDLFTYNNTKGSLPPKHSGARPQDGKILAASAPLDSPDTPQPGDHFRAAKDRLKKDSHNKIERRRRFLINDMITVQGNQLPKQGDPYYEQIGDIKQNKGAILKAGVQYIDILKQENETFRQKDSNTQNENKKLLLRIQELEKVCRESGISLPADSLTWKTPDPDRLSSYINGTIRVKQEPLSESQIYELMDDDRGERNIVTGPCDPMLPPLQVDPDDIGLAAALDIQDFSDASMEFT